jgi:hypothetical protein
MSGSGCSQIADRTIKGDSQWRCFEECNCDFQPPGGCKGAPKGFVKWRTKQRNVTLFEVRLLTACDDNAWQISVTCAPCIPNPEIDTPCDGWCCTDYGVVFTDIAKCKEWKGDFYTDAEQLEENCPCDCERQDVITVYTPPNNADGSRPTVACGFVNYSPVDDVLEGSFYVPVLGGANADLIKHWTDQGAATGLNIWGVSSYNNTERVTASTECCFSRAEWSTYQYRLYVFNCRKRVWELIGDDPVNPFLEFGVTNNPPEANLPQCGDWPNGFAGYVKKYTRREPECVNPLP